MGRHCCVGAVADHPVRERAERFVRDEVVGEAHHDGVGSGERRSGQRGVQAEMPGRPCQQIGAADVGDEADSDLGHAHLRGVGDDADAAVCALTPTPPPMTIPSISATYGLG